MEFTGMIESLVTQLPNLVGFIVLSASLWRLLDRALTELYQQLHDCRQQNEMQARVIEREGITRPLRFNLTDMEVKQAQEKMGEGS